VAQCPQPTAACCYADGTCAVTTQADCTGVWHAEWADCGVAQCPQPTAACCYADGTCAVTTQADCTGVWHAEWADCGAAQCPQPDVACCFSNGMCELLKSAACIAAGGTPGALGSRCTPNTCPPLIGDLDCDGDVDFGDINPFVLYLSNYATWLSTYPGCNPANGDIDQNGVYPSFGDINPFVALLSNPG
jgi:hypothetical protein